MGTYEDCPDESGSPLSSALADDLQRLVVVDGEAIVIGDLVEALRKTSPLLDEIVFLRAAWGVHVDSIADPLALDEFVAQARQRVPESETEAFDAGRLAMFASANRASDVEGRYPRSVVTPEIQEETPVSIHQHRQMVASEGYCPEMTAKGNIALRFQGSTCYLMIDEEDHEFIQVHRYVDLPELKDDEPWAPLLAAAQANGAYKCAKVDWDLDECRATVSAEGFFANAETLRSCLHRLLQAANSAASRFSKELEELSKSDDDESPLPTSDSSQAESESESPGDSKAPVD
jgi:hypothetical protein